MGLDTTHDCWHGPYGRFARWREALCRAAGYGNLREYKGYDGDKPWPENHDALFVLLRHPDNRGTIDWRICSKLADRLEELADEVSAEWVPETLAFANGLRSAGRLREDVEFF